MVEFIYYVNILDNVSFEKSPCNNTIKVKDNITKLLPKYTFLYIITSTGKILLHTSLDFGVEFCSAIQNGYTSAGYLSHEISAKNSIKLTNDQVVSGLETFVDFLTI